MLKGISRWKRLLALVLTIVMLFTNNCGVIEAFAEGEASATNLELHASLKVNNGKTVVEAGEKFQYQLQYTVPENSSEYTGAMLTFRLPNHVVLAIDGEGNYASAISGPDFESVTYNEITKQYTVKFVDKLPKHANNTLTIELMTKNLITPDAAELNFDRNFEFQVTVQVGDEYLQEKKPVQAGVIYTHAESNWEITKENTTKDVQNGNRNYIKIGSGADATFEVTYRVQVKDAGGIDRLGRLGFESYQVVDTLPTNLPAGGAAKEIKNVKMIRGDVNVDLASADYSVVSENGAPTSIVFNTYDKIKAGETSQYLAVGDATDTTYEYTVVYPYAPYTTSGDELEVVVYQLVNTAALNYKLVGEEAATKTDEAQVEIGAYEDNVVKANVSVAKYVQFKGSEPELLDRATADKYNFTGANSVKFTLYKDVACTNVAYNTERQLMENIGVNESGFAVFEKIRKGTYYIKEVSGLAGWTNADNIEVVIDDNGNVNYPDDDTAFIAINTADTINAVEFQKTGVDVNNDTHDGLAGATFTLTDNNGSGKTYTATSDANGKVRFNNIPDGTYTLAETAIDATLQGMGFEVSDETYTFEVAGGQVVTPTLNGDNKYQNTSTKGLLEIVKVDAQNTDKLLSGAQFDVYGPYATEAEADAAKNSPEAGKKVVTLTTVTGGKITSGPLQNGYYVLVETKAPTNYTAAAPVVVHVTERAQASVTVANNPQAKVYFTKKGAKDNSSTARVQELAGAKFEIYDANGMQLFGVKDDDGNFTDVSTDSTGRVAVVITTKLDSTGVSVSNSVTLSPGTYKYKEIEAPYPFKADATLVSFTVGPVAPSEETGAWNTSQTIRVDNYMEYGQIRIAKTTDDGATSADALNGAEFGVYESEADALAGQNPVDTIVTKEYVENGNKVQGIGYSDAQLTLDKTYYIKETKAPSGYAVNPTIQEVTMTSDKLLVEWNCVNKRTVFVEITKVDSKDSSKKLQGAVFALYTAQNEDSKLAQLTTNANGVVTFGNLDPNTTYYYKEISAPNGYVMTNSGFNAIKTGSTGQNATVTATVQNHRKATFKLHKTKEGNEAFANVEFKLFPVKDGTKDILVDTNNLSGGTTKNTDSSGNASFTDLIPGDYWLVETVPAGYETGKANGEVVTFEWKVVTYNNKEYFYKKVTVKPGQNLGAEYESQTEEITNTPTKGKIQIKKFEAKSDGTPSDITISGVTFTVYSDSACQNQVTTMTTAGNGSVTSGFLAEGTYYIKETDVPDGYVISNTVYTVTVAAGEVATTGTTNAGAADLLKIVNTKQGYFTIDKVAAYQVMGSGTNEVVRGPLNGAIFELYDINDSTKAVATIQMTDRSTADSPSLAPGIYRLHEQTAPDGFKAAPDSLVRVNGDGSIHFAEGTNVDSPNWVTKSGNKITVDNESENPRIRLIKRDYTNANVLLDGAKFEVYVLDNANGIETNVDGETVKLSPVYIDGTEQQLVLESGTARNPYNASQHIVGHALTPELEAGHTYYFKEIQAPDNYYFDPADVWQSVEISAGATGEYRVIFENYPEIQVPGIKYAADGTTPLSGAVLAIFNNAADANDMIGRLTTTYNELTNPLTAAVVEANKTDWNIVEVSTSNAQGVFSFNNLIPGNTYYIVEVVAPNGYQMDKNEDGSYFYYKVTVSDPYNSSAPFSEVSRGETLQPDVHALSIRNYAKRKIWLDKKVKLSDEEYWVSGAQFTIYPSTKDANGNLIPDTANSLGAMGMSDEKTIPGRFLSGLLPAGTYWLKETTVPDGFDEADRDVKNPAFGTDAQDFVVIDGVRYYRVDLGRENDNKWFQNNPVYNVAENGKFALTKIDSLSKRQLEATFEVEKVDDPSFKSFTFKTHTSGYYLSAYLAPGLYKLTEKEVTGGGYTVSAEPIYIRIESGKITDGTVTGGETVEGKTVTAYKPAANVNASQSGTNDPVLTKSIKIENVPQGKFFIHKIGKWMSESENLANVSFAIYKKTSDSFEADKAVGAIKTITTGSDGYADSGLLDAGDYWILETGIAGDKEAEYAQTTYTAIAVTVNAGEVTRKTDNTVDVTNTSKYGKFQVTKVDSVDATPISGVTFEIYTDENCTGTAVNTMTGNNGVYTSPRLPVGTYYLKETGVPNDYTINKDSTFGPFTVTADSLNVVSESIENEHDKSLTVYKYEKHGGEETKITIDGVTFGLYVSQEAAAAATSAQPGSPIGGVKTTESGQAVWDDLANGTYYLKELSAPSKYLLQDPANFTATDANPAANVYKVVISDKNGDSFAYSYNVYNLLKGGFELDKVIKWTNANEPGANITFKLYKDSVAEENLIDELTTDEDGKISYTDKLSAGEYILVEVDENNEYDTLKQTNAEVAGNYIDEDGNIHITVQESQTNTVFTGDNAIENIPFFGRFKLLKKTYATNAQNKEEAIGLSGAKYLLEKYDPENSDAVNDWVPVGTEYIEVLDVAGASGVYISGHMEPGKYRVTEKEAPTAIKNANGDDVYFVVDETPIEFDIKAGATVEVEQYDGIYRNLVVKKTADANNGSEPLYGVVFELYKANAEKKPGEYPYDGNAESLTAFKDGDNPSRIGSYQETKVENGGIVSFNKLLPGKYLLVETAAPTGYEKKLVVLEIDESLSYMDVEYEYILVNNSEKGRIVIRKENTSGELITQNTEQNAEFKIYAETDTQLKTVLATVSVDSTGYAKTGLLSVGKYWVVETKAPDGYTLDERLLPLKKLVTVSGDQNPQVDFTAMKKDAVDGYVDGVIFQNGPKSNTCGLDASIQKLVSLVGKNTFDDVSVESKDSLMFQDVTAEFQITNLTNANVENTIPFDKFIVTDESMKFMDKDGAEITALAEPTSDDYVMNKVTIGQATNKDTAKAVSAKVYAKAENKTAEWELVGQVDLSTEAQIVTLPENAVAFKVEYSNADVGFTAGDIFVEVTFKQRPSDPDVPQVRKVENKAELYWEDTSLDESGNAQHQSGTVSDIAAVTFPAYDENLPTLALKNDIINRPTSGKYYSGGTIDFVTEGTVPATSPADLQHPVMSINLPPYTSLDTSKYSELEGGIKGIRATLSDGTVLTFTVTKLIETNEHDQPYEKYVLDFGKDGNGNDFVLPIDESIKLEYTANISLSVPDTIISIESHGFIGSAKQLPLTAENKTGMSYRKADSDASTVTSSDAGFDAGLEELGNDIQGDSLTYLKRPVNVELTRTDSRLIRKYVSVDGENWLTSEVPVVKPGDNYYYKLTLVNGGHPVRRLRMVDIMPFTGDTQEFRAMTGGTIMNRATDLPSGAGYEQVELVAVTPQAVNDTKVTIYYYVESGDVTAEVANRDWTAENRGKKTATAELPMLTTNAAADEVWAGWTTAAPADMRQVTAIGVEVEYLNETNLASGEDYSVILTMRAPGYTAEHMHEYKNALIANTTAATVTGVGEKDTSEVTAIDRVSSNEVYTKLYITTGAIGDYAFYDNNDNGIQDEGDIPARNIPVTLYRRVSTTTMTEEPKWEVYKTTYTDQTTGEYWFDELTCNYLEPGKVKGSTNPDDYIGNAYFEYRVEFGIPDGYAATIREAGGDRAVDSNINEFGVTDPITLALTVGADGKLVGEVNPTIDAGYVKLVNLGDYVWIDYNKNGVQDEGEIGLNGATVNLYKLDSADDTIEGKVPYKTTLTDTKDGMDGYYLFEDLPKGYYVVEFDLTTVEKHTGYTTQYAFTVNDSGSDGADSDAAFVKGDNDQIMYTEVIHLTRDDMTWDAGVTVYSALGGFVFDDQDYNDTQSIPTEVDEDTTANGIPLPGTVVTLYKVNEDGSLDPKPVGRQTVGEDGRYLFDMLDAGRYKVHFDYPDKYIGVKDGVGDYMHDSETKFFDDSSLNSGFTAIIELAPDTADLTHDAGAYLVSSIGDYVWEDLDRDGIQDDDEEPVKDITVTLQQKLGDGEWTTVETTVTDENGLYLFEGLKSSDHYDVQYRVAFAIPLTVELTTDNVGDDRAEDSNALPELDVDYGYFTSEVKPPYGEDDLTIDAGLYYKDGLCEVGDYVWYDVDKDGVQDSNEKGVEGIVVVLERCESDDILDEDAWEVVATTKTDANGKYIFTKLEAGRYRIAFGLGKPWIVTKSRVGDAALDSDAIRQSKDYYYTSAFFLNVGDSDMTWDAGIYKPAIVVVPFTGDNFNMGVWVAVLLGSLAILLILLKKRKK